MTNDDELVKRLKCYIKLESDAAELGLSTAVTVDVMQQAVDSIRELEAELSNEKAKVKLMHPGVSLGTHVIVPVEPTEEMTRAGVQAPWGASWKDKATSIYRAMIKAAQEGR